MYIYFQCRCNVALLIVRVASRPDCASVRHTAGLDAGIIYIYIYIYVYIHRYYYMQILNSNKTSNTNNSNSCNNNSNNSTGNNSIFLSASVGTQLCSNCPVVWSVWSDNI